MNQYNVIKTIHELHLNCGSGMSANKSSVVLEYLKCGQNPHLEVNPYQDCEKTVLLEIPTANLNQCLVNGHKKGKLGRWNFKRQTQ